jgi:sarcosine oxidase delta subunit
VNKRVDWSRMARYVIPDALFHENLRAYAYRRRVDKGDSYEKLAREIGCTPNAVRLVVEREVRFYAEFSEWLETQPDEVRAAWGLGPKEVPR